MAKKEFIKPVFGTWVDAKVQKPRKNTSVIVCVFGQNRFHEPFVAEWDGEEFYDTEKLTLEPCPWSKKVSHWMPLPPKPNK